MSTFFVSSISSIAIGPFIMNFRDNAKKAARFTLCQKVKNGKNGNTRFMCKSDDLGNKKKILKP